MEYRIIIHHKRENKTGGVVRFYSIQYYAHTFWGGRKWKDFTLSYSYGLDTYKQRLDFDTESAAAEYVANIKKPVPESKVLELGTL